MPFFGFRKTATRALAGVVATLLALLAAAIGRSSSIRDTDAGPAVAPSAVTAALLLAKFPLWWGLVLVVSGAFAAVFADKKLIALVRVDRMPVGPRP